MSRPSATQSPQAIRSRCLATSALRTVGSAATTDAASETRGRANLIGHVPPVEQHRPGLRAGPVLGGAPRQTTPEIDHGRTRHLGEGSGAFGEFPPPRCKAASATQRYMAPLSR